MQTSILISFLQLLWMKTVLSNNFGIPFQLSYAPSTRIVTEADPASSEDNTTIIFRNFVPRQMNRAYTIVYPLTFPQNRGGRFLNLTLPPQPPLINEVQSRVISKPEPYPKFGIYSSFPVLRQDSIEGIVQPLENIPEDSYDDSSDLADDNNSIQKFEFPPLSDQYVSKSNIPFPASKVYTNESSDASTSTDNKQSISKFPSLGYGKYPPLAPNPPPRVKPVSPQQVIRPLKAPLKPVTPQYLFPQSPVTPVIKSSAPPAPQKSIAYKPRVNINTPVPLPTNINKQPKNISPQSPGKGQIFPQEPPIEHPSGINPPVGYYKKQSVAPAVTRAPQYTSCICVPYYLCKDGVLNSGGRLLDVRKRRIRSLNYIRQNKNITAVPFKSNIVNSNPVRQNRDQGVCEPNKVCCEIYFDNIDDTNNNDNVYPVATPLPELPVYPPPPRYPTKPRAPYSCGVQRVSDMVWSRQAQYPTDTADFGEYPWQIAILRKVVGDKNLYLCGGVLVAPQWIATVAHCVSKYANSPLLVRLGEWDVKRKDEIYPYTEKDVTTMVIHPDFDSETLQGDLALLRLTEPVDRLPHINPACLPTPGQVYEDQKCWVSGWGKNFFGTQGEYQNVLKEVDIPVISRSLCSSQLRSTNLGPDFVLHPGFLCAGGEVGKDACTGDGGSPLVCKSKGLWYVVGLVSWGIGCGQAGVPGVYVNVLYYTDWINKVIRNS